MLKGSLVLLPRHAPANCSSDRVTSGEWHKKTKLPTVSRGSGASGLARQSLEPTPFTTKKTLEGLT
jgi:hypothetical protein